MFDLEIIIGFRYIFGNLTNQNWEIYILCL